MRSIRLVGTVSDFILWKGTLAPEPSMVGSAGNIRTSLTRKKRWGEDYGRPFRRPCCDTRAKTQNSVGPFPCCRHFFSRIDWFLSWGLKLSAAIQNSHLNLKNGDHPLDSFAAGVVFASVLGTGDPLTSALCPACLPAGCCSLWQLCARVICMVGFSPLNV